LYGAATALLIIALFFAVVAVLYAAVGFGGGSTYTAILIESGMSWQLIPPISLTCNLIVVTGGVYHFRKKGHLDLKFAAPFILSSVPAAFAGGYLRIDEALFMLVLSIALLIAGTLLLVDRRWNDGAGNVRESSVGTRVSIGVVLGALAGVTGIGGGIYLAPLLHLGRLADTRSVAALCSLFILVNSAAGLAGQILKLGQSATQLLDPALLLLPAAVLVGGQIGSRAGSRFLPAKPIRQLTGAVILLVAVRLLSKTL
jgi:uncharacterized membrane protein YfcA